MTARLCKNGTVNRHFRLPWSVTIFSKNSEAHVYRAIRTAAIFLAALGLCQSARANSTPGSGITFFRADVTVREDATLEVREEIAVRNASSFYKHGFQRDLPISLTDRWDTRYVGTYQKDNHIRVKILEVTEDGQRAEYEMGQPY